MGRGQIAQIHADSRKFTQIHAVRKIMAEGLMVEERTRQSP